MQCPVHKEQQLPYGESLCGRCYADIEKEHAAYAHWLQTLPLWRKIVRFIVGVVVRKRNAIIYHWRKS